MQGSELIDHGLIDGTRKMLEILANQTQVLTSIQSSAVNSSENIEDLKYECIKYDYTRTLRSCS